MEFPKKRVVGKLVCFFCDEEFESVDVLHSHQNKCSSVSYIQTVLANVKSCRIEKRGFLSRLNLISKGKAEHLRSAQQLGVVVDAIVIDDNSDDEDAGSIGNKSMHYLRTPNSKPKSIDEKPCSGKSNSNGQMRTGKFPRQSWKIFKFDVTSPLGMRLQYRGSCAGDSRLPYCRVVNDSEQFCGHKSLRTSETLSWNKQYPVMFRKTHRLDHTHRYKFTRRQWREICETRRCGLSPKSRKLKQQMRPCSIELKKLALCSGHPKTVVDITEYMHLLPPKSFARERSKAAGEVVLPLAKICKPQKCSTSNALLDLTAKQEQHSTAPITVVHEAATVVSTLTSSSICLNSSCDPPIYSVASPIACSVLSTVGSTENKSSLFQMNYKEGKVLFGNVEFVPLSALCEQTERENDLCQISDVFSLAETSLHDDIAGECMDVEESTMCAVGNTSFNEEDFLQRVPDGVMTVVNSEPRLIPETVIFDSKSCDHSDSSSSQQHQHSPSTAAGTATMPLITNCSVIDLTEPSLQLAGIISQTSKRENRYNADIATVSHTNSPLDNITTSKSSANRHEIQNPQMTTDVTKPVVIEIPDEDTTMTSTIYQDVSMRPSDSLNTAAPERMPAINVSRHCEQSANSRLNQPISNILGQLLPDSRPVAVRCSTTCEQSADQSNEGISIQNCDLIDLCADSDCESTGHESLTSNTHNSNADGSLAQRTTKAGTTLEDCQLPALTFRCHICDCLLEFNQNCGLLIKDHYLAHNVANVEIFKHRHPHGRTSWSMVQLDYRSTFTFPPHPVNNDQNKNDSRGSVVQPTVTSPLVSSCNADVLNHDRSSKIMRTLEWSQHSNISHPKTNMQLDKNPFGFKGVDRDFENCLRQPGGRVAEPCVSKLSVTVGSGDGVVFQRGRGTERKLASEGLVRSAGVGSLKPPFQQNSFEAFHIFPQPNFPNNDGENSALRQMAKIHPPFEKAAKTKGQASRNTDCENSSKRGNLVEANRKYYNSFSVNNKCSQGVICLD